MAEGDIFREVEEDLRRERYEALWKQYGNIVVAAALVIILGVAAYKGWQYWQQSRAETAGARFEGALQLFRDGKTDEAVTALSALVSDAPVGYQTLGRMRLAAEDAKAGKKAEAIAQYQAVADDASVDSLLRGFAQLRVADLRIDDADFTEMQNRLTPLMAEGQPWRYSAEELMGLAAYKAGNAEAASRSFTLLLSDPGAPQGLRQRAEMMMTLIAADTAKPPAANN
jgi:hypothetical protein